MKSDQITIFTDGSSRGNPGPGGWGFVVIYPNGRENISEVMLVEEDGGQEGHTTNNRMELMAVIKSLELFDDYYDKSQMSVNKFEINLDSLYVLNGITKWVFGWSKNGWKTSTKNDVGNVDLWQRLMKATANKNIEWKLLKGHSGIAGNERCDEIATGNGGELFKGKFSNYNIDPFAKIGTSIKSKSSKSSGKAYSYVSAVDGLVMTHKTWIECEKRVKGAKGARFKKALNAEDERNLIINLGNI